jgi:thiamine-monophosphate kinase
MGAEPEALLVSLAVPPAEEADNVFELYEGMTEAGVPVVGGDTVAAETVSMTVTAVGRSERVPGRAGARPGDVVVVTGPLGAAAAGLHALRHGLEGLGELMTRHRRPPVRIAEGKRLARTAHAMIDLSDGIGADAARIAERSGCAIAIDVERVPKAEGIERAGDHPFWTMGEDYELLAALSPEDAEETGFAVVGACREGAGVEPPSLGGWRAF